MKILQVHTRYSLHGGEDRVVASERELLVAAGHEVVAFERHNRVDPVGGSRDLLLSPWNPIEARALSKVVREVRPDVAHVHNTWFAMSPAVLRVLDRAGVPTVVTLHNYRLHCIDGGMFRDGAVCRDCVGHTPLSGVIERCYRDSRIASGAAATTIVLHRALGTWRKSVDLFVTPSAAARAEHTAAGISPERIVVKSHFAVDPGPRVRRPSESRTIVYAGRLSMQKGVDVLLDAWEALAPPDLDLVLIGDGPLRPRAQAAPHRTTFLGQLEPDDVRAHLQDARALVFPSVWVEPFGMVLIEAMACGLPIIASDVGAVREIVGGVPDDLVVPQADRLALQRALARVQDDDALLDALGDGLRQRYEQGFRPETHAMLLEEIYSDAIARRARKR